MKLLPALLGSLIACVWLGADALAQGPQPPEVVAWDEAARQKQRDAGAELLKAIQEAIDGGKRYLAVPRGHYRFAKPVNPDMPRWGHAHVLLKGVNDFTLDGQGSTFWFETGSVGIYLDRCKNVTLRNLTLDWDPLPFTQGKVVSVDTKTSTVEVQLDPGYDRVTPEFAAIPEAGGLYSRLRFAVVDPETKRFKKGSLGMRCDPFWHRKTKDGNYQVKVVPFWEQPLSEANVEEGDAVVMMYRDLPAVAISVCSGTLIDGVTVYASPMIAFMETTSEQRTTYRRVKVQPRPGTNRLIAGNADGIQIANARQGPLIEGCEISSIGDDFVNPHGYYYRVFKQESPTVLLTDMLGYRKEVEGWVRVRFMARGTFEDLGSRLARVEYVEHTPAAPQSELFKTPTRWAAGGMGDVLKVGEPMNANRLTLDRPIELPPDVIMACEDFTSPGTEIRGNKFANNLALGIRGQSPGMVVEGNTIEWTAGPAIQLLTQPDFWGESDYPHGAVVRNNTIADPMYARQRKQNADGAISVTSIGDLSKAAWISTIDISGNTIQRAPRHGVRVFGVRNLMLRNNKVNGFGLDDGPDPVAPPAPKATAVRPPDGPSLQYHEKGFGLVIEHVRGIYLDGNTIDGAGPIASAKENVLQHDAGAADPDEKPAAPVAPAPGTPAK